MRHGGMVGQPARAECEPAHTNVEIEPEALTLTLSRFAGEGTPAVRLLDSVPSTAKRERVRARAGYSVSAITDNPRP